MEGKVNNLGKIVNAQQPPVVGQFQKQYHAKARRENESVPRMNGISVLRMSGL
jgi:hypothetical protein